MALSSEAPLHPHGPALLSFLLLHLATAAASSSSPSFCHGMACPGFDPPSAPGLPSAATLRQRLRGELADMPESLDVRQYHAFPTVQHRSQGCDEPQLFTRAYDFLLSYIVGELNVKGEAIQQELPVLSKITPVKSSETCLQLVQSFPMLEKQQPKPTFKAATSGVSLAEYPAAVRVVWKLEKLAPVADLNLIADTLRSMLETSSFKLDGSSFHLAVYDGPYKLAEEKMHYELWLDVKYIIAPLG